jgi:TolA-binding protein
MSMRSSASYSCVRLFLFVFLTFQLLSSGALAEGLGGGGGLTPEQELELEYADRLLASGLADYARMVTDKLSLPPEIMDIRKIKNYGALGKFEEAKAVIAKRPGDSQEVWTLKLTLADSYYMWGRYQEAQGIYESFFNKFPDGPKESIKAFYLESAYKYSQMLLLMNSLKPACKAYRYALSAKPARHIERQLKSELAEVLLRRAKEASEAERDALLKQTKDLVDEILWVQDLWFGRGIVMLAHMRMLNNNIEGAMALIDDFRDQLKDIDRNLRKTAEQTGEDLTKLSPMAQCRYMIGMIMHDESKRILKEGGDRQKAYSLLVGSGGKDGAVQHFLNVFIRYPNTSWAPDAGNRFYEIQETLKVVWDKEIKAKITKEQWEAVEQAQFREARSLFNQQQFENAIDVYEQVLKLFPERETSVSALGQLAACYMETEQYLLAETVARHLAERFSQNKDLMSNAGDQVLRIAFNYSERGDKAREQETYDIFFTYCNNHPRIAGELFRFGESSFREKNYDQAMSYYTQVVSNYVDKPVFFDALSKIAYIYGEQDKQAEEIKALKQLIDALEKKDHPGHALPSTMFRFANALKKMGDRYLPLAITKYSELEKLLGDEQTRIRYQNSGDEAEANKQILQGAMFYRAMADCMRSTVPKKIQAYFDKKYKRKVPPELILKSYYKSGAIKTLLELVEKFPESPFAPAALSQVGTLYTVLEKPDDARKTLQQLKKDYPKSSEAENADYLMGKNLLDMGMEREAVTFFKEMFSGKGDYKASQILTAGKALFEAKQYKIAIEAFDRVIKTEQDRSYLEPARLKKSQSLVALKKYDDAAEMLRSMLEDYPKSGYTIEICRSASEAFSAVASKMADENKRFELFNEAVSAMKRARKFAKDSGPQTELDVGVAQILERKAAAEREFGNEDKAIEYRNDAVAAYQTVIMFRNPNDEEVAPHMQDAYVYCLPLLLEMERFDDALQDATRYLSDFPNGKHTLKVRQYQSRARVGGGGLETETEDETGPETELEEPTEADSDNTPEEG